MSSNHKLILFLCLVTLASWSQAQENTTYSAAESGDTMSVPSPLSGVGSSLAFASELAHFNFVNAGISVGGTFDDNALNSSSGTIGDYGYQFMPFISLNQSRPRLRWTLNYAGGFMINERFSTQDQGSHNLGFGASYRLSPHVNLTVADHFFMTTNLYNQLNQNLQIPPPGLLQQPNQTLVAPLATQTGNTGTVQLDYQFSRNDQVGGVGSLSQTHYANAPTGFNLVDSHSKLGEAFYNHRLSPRNSVGVSYIFDRLAFSPIAEEVDVHSVFLVYTIQLQRMMSLSFFAGPQYSDLQTTLSLAGFTPIPLSQKTWSTAGGASYSWNGKHTSLVINFSRKVNDGGGLQGPVQVSDVDGSVRRQLTRSLTVQFGAGYAQNDALGTILIPNAFSSYKTAFGSLGLERSLGNNFFARLGYAHNYQLQEGGGLTASQIDHNRVWVSVSYQFGRPLGR